MNRMSKKEEWRLHNKDRYNLYGSKYNAKIEDRNYISDCKENDVPVKKENLRTFKNFYSKKTFNECVSEAVKYQKFIDFRFR